MVILFDFLSFITHKKYVKAIFVCITVAHEEPETLSNQNTSKRKINFFDFFFLFVIGLDSFSGTP